MNDINLQCLNTEEKKKLLIKLLRQKQDSTFPLACNQKALATIHHLAPESPAYNVVIFSCRFLCNTDPERVKNVYQKLVDKYPALRTVFELHKEKPVQKIKKELSISMGYHDVANQSEEELRQTVQKAYEAPFDLTNGPLTRIELFQKSEEQQILLITAHHMIVDLASVEILIRDLEKYLAAEDLKQIRETPIPDRLHIQHVQQEEKLLEGTRGKQLRDYWKRQLSGEIPTLSLPLDYSRPTERKYQGKTFQFSFDDKLNKALIDFSKERVTTLFMTLLASFQSFLHRYTGQNKILVGSPVGGRNRDYQQEMVNYLANLVVLDAEFSEQTTFEELLERTKTTTLGALDHQEFPFFLLTEELNLKSDPGTPPLVQSVFIYQDIAESSDLEQFLTDSNHSFTFGKLPVQYFPVDQQEGQYDITLEVYKVKNRFQCALKYDQALFEQATIVRMAEDFQCLLQSILTDPTMPIGKAEILPESRKEQLLVEWNRTEKEYPDNKTIQELFAEQARKTPNNIAVSFEGNSLTYSEFDEKSNRLAHYLIERGVQTEDLVGICMERSLEMLVGLFAILKAGAAYVPLDPIYPKERVHAMVKDARLKLLLTEEKLTSLFSELSDQTVLYEEARDSSASLNSTVPTTSTTAENLAYVIYTSGTTGKPKGVRISHKNLINFIYSMKEQPGLDEGDTLLSVTTICFDIFGLELYLPLLFGGTHYLISSQVAADGRELANHLERSGATIMQATPATWNMLLEEGWSAKTPLKVLCGGEPLPRKLRNALTDQQNVTLWNMYGPTETTIWSGVEEITGEEEKITIGKPIANTLFYILDDHLNPVPIGTVGEIFIGGDGVSEGYLRREELTAERFVPNPFNKEASALYRTGDLGRYLPDGRVECLGRKDQQVKIRGFRIELEDIEYHLNQYNSIREAVATVEGDDEEKTLIAWLVVNDEESVAPEAILNQLREKLPHYMLPGEFRILRAIPKTPNGKVDRKQLSRMESKRVVPKVDIQPLENKQEEKIAQIWKEVLKLEETVGRNQNFFDIGGQSLLLVKLAKGLNEQFDKEITVPKLFRFPTIQAQAEYYGLNEEKKRTERKNRQQAWADQRRGGRAKRR